MILATFTVYLMSAICTPEPFLAWGWRVPFLFSIVLVFLGQWIPQAR